MLARVLVASLMIIVACSSNSSGQQQPTTTAPGSEVQEFPVVFQRSVTAGKTPVGTTVQAKLSMATLLNGIVVPQNAKFSGEIVVSQARTKNQASRLSLRMDSVSWENGSARVKVFLSDRFSPRIPEPQYLQPGKSSAPEVSHLATAEPWEKMKDVDSERTSDGVVTLVCKQHTVKIYRYIMYVLTTGDLAQTMK
jgi:hypothetical protein